MITNTHRGDFYSVPLFRLESAVHTVLWIKGMQGRSLIAATLHKMFPEGCGVCSDTCRLMGLINPRGGIREIPAPWPEYPIHQMVNNPRPEIGSENECPCFDFLDPEVGGPWRLRGLNHHHPLCMYLKGSGRRYEHFVSGARYELKVTQGKYQMQGYQKLREERPDAWFRSLKEIP